MGRPTKYDPQYHLPLAKWMCRSGLTDAEIAREFGVTEQTVNNWKRAHPEFKESLREAKELADSYVEDSLYRRALGYEYDEVTMEHMTIEGPDGEKSTPATRVRTVRKQVAPDVTAQIFWLKNRQPRRWRDRQEHDVTVKGRVSLSDLIGGGADDGDGDGLTDG